MIKPEYILPQSFKNILKIFGKIKLNQNILSVIYKRITSVVEWGISFKYYKSIERDIFLVYFNNFNATCVWTTSVVMDTTP